MVDSSLQEMGSITGGGQCRIHSHSATSMSWSRNKIGNVGNVRVYPTTPRLLSTKVRATFAFYREKSDCVEISDCEDVPAGRDRVAG